MKQAKLFNQYIAISGNNKQSSSKQNGESPNHKSKKLNGAKDAISRYKNLRANLDSDLFNQNWRDVNTKNIATTKTKYNFVDLFAGAGGLSVGFKQAGFNKIFSIEIDHDAVNTLRNNFPESYHFEGNIESVTQYEMDKIIKGRKIHVVCGGPPCQGFSVAGLRNPHDPRNQLFREFIRIVKHLKPDVVVLENVPGILTMQLGEVYKEILKQFSEIGYPNMSVRIIEAAEFGVPQLRTRAVFIGNRKGVKNLYPKPQLKREEYKPIESAMDDLKDKKPDPSINHEWTWHSEATIKRISKIPPGGSLYETFRDAFKRQYKGVPSMTAKENHGGTHIHYIKDRVLSARELARLQTFPDDFIFSGTMKRAYWQIGNAVPCLLAKNIALSVKQLLEQTNN